MKLKYLDEIKWYDERDKKLVIKLLTDWTNYYDSVFNLDVEVRKDDFKNNNVFFFTNCKDLLGNMSNENQNKNSYLVRQRKDYSLLTTFLKKLSGTKFDLHLETCSTCGYSPLDVVPCYDNWSYFHYCSKCRKYVLVTFPPGFDSSYQAMYDHAKGLEKEDMKQKKDDERKDVT